VDIISLSWAFQKSSFELQEVLERAATSANGKDPILVFCSKSDESFSGNVFPADLDTTISVAAALSNATGSFGGHVSKPPDIVLYGQDMPVGGLQYARNQKNVATGSSVATALASGMASLLLGLARAEGQGERGADPKQKRHLQLVGKESGASESDEDEVGTAKTSSVKNAIFVSSLKRRENMLDILRSFKTDRSNVIPFVDPNIMFKNTSRKGPPVDLLRTAHEVVRRNNQQQGR
jgi:hypothetical protein